MAKSSRKHPVVPPRNAEPAASPAADFSRLKPVPKNRRLLIISLVLLVAWMAVLVGLVFVSR